MTQFSTTWMGLGGLILAIGLAGGCVSQKHADNLDTVNRTTQQQLADLQGRLNEAESRNRALQGQLAGEQQNRARIDALLAERARLEAALAQAGDALRSASFQGPLLPAELDQALVDLAASNPELMSYDPQLGMVKFQSDLTFALGSVAVSDSAKATLNRLAEILRRPVAEGYEARIVGHTDNVPIRQPQTLASHPTNWHLSVHRAIAVKDVLVAANVPAVRIGVAGYGEHRPIAANPAGGNERNRRVEIYLTPTTHRGPVQATTSTTPGPRTTPTAPEPQPSDPAVFK